MYPLYLAGQNQARKTMIPAAATAKTIAKIPAVVGTGSAEVPVTATDTAHHAEAEGTLYWQTVSSSASSRIHGDAEVKRMKKATERKTEAKAPMS